jgi:hypothetical protein
LTPQAVGVRFRLVRWPDAIALAALTALATACATGSSYVGAGGGGTGTTTATTTASTTGGTCPSSPCKLTSPQCGCAAPSACTISNYMPACEPAGTTGENQICTSPSSCEAGTLCIGSGSTGVCEKFCATDGDCSGGTCSIQLSDGMDGAIAGVSLCSNVCDLQAGSGCPAGASCQIGMETTGQMRVYTYCTSAGTKGDGKKCTTASDCAPTYGCFDSGSGTTCAEYCYVGSANACAGCAALTDTTTNMPIVVDGQTVGTCP